LRSYARWLRLVQATERLADGDSITAAAHAAGFADGPHFTRAFKSMFGLAPSEVMSTGTWLR
jgi:AraC-like DNA-binding protein